MGVSCCCGNHFWFAFILWCGYCFCDIVSFQSFVLRHLVIAPVCKTKKLPKEMVYLTEFAKTWLKKFQVHFNNLTSKSNGKQ